MADIQVPALGVVACERRVVKDDFWGDVLSRVQLTGCSPGAFDGLEAFSHVSVLFHMDQVKPEKVIYDARHPRNDENLPKMGILAQRGKNRPNAIGLSPAEVVKVTDDSLYLRGLDAVHGTPVVGVAPMLRDLEPNNDEVVEPDWLQPLMQDYYVQVPSEEAEQSRMSALVWEGPGPADRHFQSLGAVTLQAAPGVSVGNWQTKKAKVRIDEAVMPVASATGLDAYSHVQVIVYDPSAETRCREAGVLSRPGNAVNGVSVVCGTLQSVAAILHSSETWQRLLGASSNMAWTSWCF